MSEAAVLQATMTDRAVITRQVWNGAVWKTQTAYEALPCALSRSAQAATPKLHGQWADLAETDTRLGLFLPAGTVLLAGDRAEITREGMIFRGICSAGLPYPSHVFANIIIQEVQQV